MTALITDDRLSQLTEHIRDWRMDDVVVDRKERTIRNIALTGLESANGYRYSEEALRSALVLYEGKPVFLDHARQATRPFDRSTRDFVGTVVNARFEAGRIRGDIHTLETEAGRTFIALAESKSPAVGMSHVVLARRNNDNTIVEKIEEVVCVDAVVFPATSSTFQEQRQEFDGERFEELQVETESLQQQVESLQENLRNLEAERDDLRMKLDGYQTQFIAAERRGRVDELLRESQLPDFAVTELWKRQLLEANDDAACRQMIAERKTLLSQLRVQPPGSRERSEPGGSPSEDAVIITAIRGNRNRAQGGLCETMTLDRGDTPRL